MRACVKWTKEMQQFMVANRLLSVKQIAQHCGVANNTVYTKLNKWLYKMELKTQPPVKPLFKRPAAVYSNETHQQFMNRILNS